MGAVRLTQSFTAFRDRPTLRVSLRIENTGPKGTTVTVTAGGRHGGAQNASLAATASGDAILDATDPWYVMTSIRNDIPVVSTALFGTSPGVLSPVQTTLTREVLSTGFVVSVPAGATRRLVFFSDLWETVPEAVDHMPAYESTRRVPPAKGRRCPVRSTSPPPHSSKPTTPR
jgi:hypothetical protein